MSEYNPENKEMNAESINAPPEDKVPNEAETDEESDEEDEPTSKSGDATQCEQCGNTKSSLDKWKYTLITTVLFLIVVHPETYKLVHSLIGKVVGKIASKDGAPTILGIMVHSVVFTLLLRGLMEIKI